ncbi:GNAT family N-acetyltransferase [Williamsia sp. M5A3_1d]
MPNLVDPVLDAEFFVRTSQPTLDVVGGAVLRPWERHDADAVRRAYADPSIQRWHSRRVDNSDEALEMVERWRSTWSTGTGCQWALVDSTTTELMGRVALKRVDHQDGNAEVAYWMVPAARGHGMCSAAVDAMSQWAFDHAGFHRLHLEHSVANHASCRTAERAGFPAEGTHRSSVPHVDGWHDMHFHGRVASAAQHLRDEERQLQ